MLSNIPISPPQSSASSSRTMSIASDSSVGSFNAPMSTEDAKIIFNNIAELALFSDMFCDRLQDALGAVVEGGIGEDCVGDLFRRIVSLHMCMSSFSLTSCYEDTRDGAPVQTVYH